MGGLYNQFLEKKKIITVEVHVHLYNIHPVYIKYVPKSFSFLFFLVHYKHMLYMFIYNLYENDNLKVEHILI